MCLLPGLGAFVQVSDQLSGVSAGALYPSDCLYRAPVPLPGSLFGPSDGDLLGLLPKGLYRRDQFRFPIDGRDVCIISDPAGIRQVLISEVQNFPKSDLMIAALKPLLGNGILISNGPVWQRQRATMEPAFQQMGVRRQFPVMAATVEDFLQRLVELGPGSEINLDAEISLFALDVIFRTIFSKPIEPQEAREIFQAFSVYQDRAPQFEALTSLFVPRLLAADAADEALGAIGERIRELVERRIHSAAADQDNILQALMTSRDPASGGGFDSTELVDQITVLVLAGHETSASALAWCIFLLSQQPGLAEQIREEAEALASGRSLTQEELNKIVSLRNAFRETLRLYPPSAFMTRVAKSDTTISGSPIRAGDLVIVSPWLVHRHHKYWQNPEHFDPDRFSAERERNIIPGTYIPFGLGPRVCTGRSVAMIEGPLLVGELLRKFRFTTLEPESVIPAYRLLVRPKTPIRCRVDWVSAK
jgi:cytochrome P450